MGTFFAGILAYVLLISWSGRESSNGTFRGKAKEDLYRVAVGVVFYLFAASAAIVGVNVALGLLLAPFNATFESDLSKEIARIEIRTKRVHLELYETPVDDVEDDAACLADDLEEELEVLGERRQRLEAKRIWPDWPKETGRTLQHFFPAAAWLYVHLAARREKRMRIIKVKLDHQPTRSVSRLEIE